MDPNTELILAKAAQSPRWEDEEKATNDLDLLREEFQRWLYSPNGQEPARGNGALTREER
jgi:hypothetical protein